MKLGGVVCLHCAFSDAISFMLGIYAGHLHGLCACDLYDCSVLSIAWLFFGCFLMVKGAGTLRLDLKFGWRGIVDGMMVDS